MCVIISIQFKSDWESGSKHAFHRYKRRRDIKSFIAISSVHNRKYIYPGNYFLELLQLMRKR
jgi:hypothetical protein